MKTAIKVNPIKIIEEEIRKKLKENDYYCPCRVEKTPETKCMCKEFREQIKKGELGVCHCGLYSVVSVDKEGENN